MTPARESIVIPLLFLTVTLLGGLRIAAGVTLTPPSLTALILALVLIGTLVRGGAFNVLALLNGGRSGLENVSGSVVLICLFAATAQAINLLLPDRGLLHAAFAIFIFCQLLTMTAARTDRPGMLRSLGVLLGSLFVLRYIIVEALYAPDRGLLHRVLTAMLSGASLGGIVYEPHAPVTGYVAFFTLMLYVVGLLLLPTTPATTTTAMVRRTPTGTRTALHACDADRPGPRRLRRLGREAGGREGSRSRQACRGTGVGGAASGGAAIGPGLARAIDASAAGGSEIESDGRRRVQGFRRRFLPPGDQGDGGDDAEIRLRAARRADDPREVRPRQSGAARRSGRHPAARRARVRRRPDVCRPHGPVRRMHRGSPFTRCGAWPKPASSAPASRAAWTTGRRPTSTTP